MSINMRLKAEAESLMSQQTVDMTVCHDDGYTKLLI